MTTKYIYFTVWAANDNTYNKTCETSKDSDQPAHPHSLIRVCTGRMCHLQPPGYPKRDKREALPYWVHNLIWVFAGHKGLIVGFVVSYIIREGLNRLHKCLGWLYASLFPYSTRTFFVGCSSCDLGSVMTEPTLTFIIFTGLIQQNTN